MSYIDIGGRIVPKAKRHALPSEEFDQEAQEAALLGYNPLEVEKDREFMPIHLWDDVETLEDGEPMGESEEWKDPTIYSS